MMVLLSYATLLNAAADSVSGDPIDHFYGML
jgi:hypothetical protein